MRDTTKELNKLIQVAASGDGIHKLAGKVLELQTADKFRLAAALLDYGRVELAEVVATRAGQEIELARLFGKTEQKVKP